MITVEQAIFEITDSLTQAGIPDAAIDARLLVMHATGSPREELLMHPQIMLPPKQEEELRALTARRASFEPMAHLLGTKEFWGHNFRVTKDTLIPRPDTETLIEAVLARVGRAEPHRVLDLGTGTGCLLLSLLSELPAASGVGVDASDRALTVARANALSLRLTTRAEWIKSNWCAGLEPSQKFQIVVANPPYIPSNDCEHLMPDVALYEPRMALDGGEDGLSCYRTLAEQLPAFVEQGTIIALETGVRQAGDVAALFVDHDFNVEAIVADLSGISRCVVLKA